MGYKSKAHGRKTAERSDDYRKVIPEGEKECVWVAAGVVHYKLCNFEFDCVNCSFDMVMRGEGDLVHWREDTGGGVLCGHRFYSPCHIWALVEEKAFVRIGIDDFGQKVLGPLEKISLPLKDEKIDKKSIRLKAQESVIPVVPPVEGYVEEVNESLISRPQLINESPYDKGWLVRLRPTSLSRNLKKMFYGADAREWLEVEANRLMALIGRELNRGVDKQLGATMPDGGVPDFDLLIKLDPAIRKKVLESCFLASQPSDRK